MEQTDQKVEPIPNKKKPTIRGACPNCNSTRTRRAATKTGGGLFKRFFCKPYRCRACRKRFWLLSPLRVFFFFGLILTMTAVVTASWIYVDEKLKSVKPIVALAKAANGQQSADNNIGEIEVNFGKDNMGIKGDEVATQWFGKAAGHNNVEGQYFYGKALLEGRGITQDFRQAVYWLEKAAHMGYGDAQLALGEMYRMGSGIEIDLERAYLWFNLAASQGIKQAASSRDSMAKLLSPDQLSAMQNEAKRISSEIQRPTQPPTVVGQPK